MKRPILSLEEMVSHVKKLGKKYRIAITSAEDPNTIGAIFIAVKENIAEAYLIGDKDKIKEVAREKNISHKLFNIINIPDATIAVSEAVRMVRNNKADILMKGLIGTDKFLKAIMNKKNGLLPDGALMSYVCALDLPKYSKLLFLSDTAVVPYPTLKQKVAMIKYSVKMAQKFGIDQPKVALLGASEKASDHFYYSKDYTEIKNWADKGEFGNCIIDGPLDVFLACDKNSIKIKEINTPVNGEADILIFPSLESSNTFYKGLMLFGGGELAGLIQGTTKPVIVMSRSESPKSKFYCIALACLMVE